MRKATHHFNILSELQRLRYKHTQHFRVCVPNATHYKYSRHELNLIQGKYYVYRETGNNSLFIYFLIIKWYRNEQHIYQFYT